MYEIPQASAVQLSLQQINTYSTHFPTTMILALNDRAFILQGNALFLKETGYAAEDIHQQPMRSITNSPLFGEVDVGAVNGLHEWEQYLQEPIPIQMNKANGDLMLVTVLAIPLETKAGKVYLLLINNADAVQGANLVQRFGETIFHDDYMGVILLDSDNTSVIDINPLACQLLGVSKSMIMNAPLALFFANAPDEYEFICQSLAGATPIRNYPLTWTLHEGQTELLMDTGLLHGPCGEREGAYIIFKDVTSLRSLEKQVQRSDRLSMIGQVAAGAAHEIRNPLTAIRGFLQIFRKTTIERGMSKETEYTEIMLTELDRINDLVGEFLMLSKPRETKTEWIDIDSVLREIMPVIASEALLNGVAVSWDMEAELPPVMADREMLKQVFLNICKNGIEAMSKGGILTVRSYVSGEGEERQLFIDMEDTGPGIPSALMDTIFDPFVTTKLNGTGLGLSVCQRIMHDFGGLIRAGSTENGARFTVILPY